MYFNSHIPDRVLGLLIICETLHKYGYQFIDNGLLAKVVKNTSLKAFYPEGRELPNDDPLKEINPWFDEIFNVDFPQLEEAKLIERSTTRDSKGRKINGVILTKEGRVLANLLMHLAHYQKLKSETFKLLDEGKSLTKKSTFTPTLMRYLRLRGKEIFKDEKLVFDISSSSPLPVGFAVEEGKLTPYIDLKQWLSSLKMAIEEKLRQRNILRAYHDETQWQFIEKVRKNYHERPLPDLPLIEICGLCTYVENIEHNSETSTRLILTFEGNALNVIARNSCLPRELEYHSLRVIGFLRSNHGYLRMEAVQIYDRGKAYPTDIKSV